MVDEMSEVSELSEEDARSVLSEAGSDAADPALYRARRISGGWSFGWREDAGPPLIGTVGWVVADNGKFFGQPGWATAEDVARSLLEDRPVARPWD